MVWLTPDDAAVFLKSNSEDNAKNDFNAIINKLIKFDTQWFQKKAEPPPSKGLIIDDPACRVPKDKNYPEQDKLRETATSLCNQKKYLDTMFSSKRLFQYHPAFTSISKKTKLPVIKSTMVVSKKKIRDDRCKLAEKKAKAKSDQKLLKTSFTKRKAYVDDQDKLITVYGYYKIPLKKYLSIQAGELSREVITESFQNRFVKKTYKTHFFNGPVPFLASAVITDSQKDFMKSMYTVDYSSGIKRIRESTNLQKLSMTMFKIFNEVYETALTKKDSPSGYVFSAMQLANAYAGSINNISTLRSYNSLATLLHLNLRIHAITFTDLCTQLKLPNRINFERDVSFKGSVIDLQEITETDFHPMKPMAKIYESINVNGKFNYNDPFNALTVTGKCTDDIIPGLYAEYCLLRLLVIMADKLGHNSNVNSIVLAHIKRLAENTTIFSDSTTSIVEEEEGAAVEEDEGVFSSSSSSSVMQPTGNIFSMYPGLFTAILHMCVQLSRQDLVRELLKDLKVLHSKDYQKDKTEAISLSKQISWKVTNVCRLITYSFLSDNYQRFIHGNIKLLLNSSLFLIFNAGGEYLLDKS